MHSTPHPWSLSHEALDRLLEALGSDRDAASVEYEALRRRLIHFFDWRGSLTPDVLADQTLDRVARKLQEGEVVEDVGGYVFGVARYVLYESHRRDARERTALEAVGRAGTPVEQPDAADLRAQCLNTCLDELPEEGRRLIVEYYEGVNRTRLAERKALAARLGLTYSALRSRAHRLRGALEICLRKCVDGKKGRDR